MEFRIYTETASTIKLVIGLYLLLSNTAAAETFEAELSREAIARTQFDVRYDGAYHSIGYPGGDVPKHIGVCTDLIIRSYRALGIDLQQLVHEDMTSAFDAYPSKRIWGLSKPDSNIDHRRVPNLRRFFERHGKTLAISRAPTDYSAGDIVSWNLAGSLPHIGIVTDKFSNGSSNPLIVHNIGAGPKLEDVLFSYEITGHYRYEPES